VRAFFTGRGRTDLSVAPSKNHVCEAVRTAHSMRSMLFGAADVVNRYEI